MHHARKQQGKDACSSQSPGAYRPGRRMDSHKITDTCCAVTPNTLRLPKKIKWVYFDRSWLSERMQTLYKLLCLVRVEITLIKVTFK